MTPKEAGMPEIAARKGFRGRALPAFNPPLRMY